VSGITVQTGQALHSAESDSAQSGSAIQFVEAIKSLPDALRQPLEEMLSSKDGQEVLNEEGLPVVEIREQNCDNGAAQPRLLQNLSASISKETEASGYWSPAAVESRRKLRERLFADGSDSDQETESSIEEMHVVPVKTTPLRNIEQSPLKVNEEIQAARVEFLPERLPEVGGRKSVSFAPHTNVRTFEKGAAIPIPPSGSVRSTQKSSVPGGSSDDSPFRGLKKGFLAPSRESKSSNTSDISARPKDSSETIETKRSASTADAPSKVSRPEIVSAYSSFRSEIFPDTQEGPVSFPPSLHGQSDERMIPSSGDTLEPLAPGHENVQHRQSSIFLARQEASRMPMLPRRSEGTPMIRHTDATGPERKGDPMKFKVMERPPKPSASQRIQKAPENGRANRTVPPDVDADRASSFTPSPHREEEQESDESFEYSDTESINFDMDNGLLAREAAMAYHQKRSQLGRRALGGWTGHVDESGTTGFYSEEMDAARGSSDVVPFGGMVLPGADLRSLNVSTDEDDARDAEMPSITLPSLIPGAENLPSMIRIGKLENGNLILQDEENLVDEGEEQGDRSTSQPQTAATENSMKKRNKANILARLSKGELEEMLREEAIQEKEMKEARVIVDYNANALPQVRTEPDSATERSKGERDSSIPVSNIVTERKTTAESSTQQQIKEDTTAKPIKISRFKAARLRGST
jgi:hypothetical protein